MHAKFNPKPMILHPMYKPKLMLSWNLKLGISETKPLGEIGRVHNQAASLVARVQADANQQVTQAHEESRRAREATEKVRAEATQIIHQAQGETRQALASRQEYEDELHRKDQMLILANTQFDEMQSQMHQMLEKMNNRKC